MARTENIVNTLSELISDAVQYGDSDDAAKSILEDFATVPISEMPEVQRIGDSLVIRGYTFNYGMVSQEAMYDMALRALAGLRFLELEEEDKAEAERVERDELLTESYTLYAAMHPEPLAQWEFELLVHDEELEKWISVALAARRLHKSD